MKRVQPGDRHDLRGIAEESKETITDELRRSIQAEHKEAVKIGDLEKYKKTARVVKPQFDVETYPNARRAGEDQLTLRIKEKEQFAERDEGEGTCAASPFKLCWLPSFVPLCGFGSFERNFDALD